MKTVIRPRKRTSTVIRLLLAAALLSAASYLFFPCAAGWEKAFRIIPSNIQDIVFAFTLFIHLAWAAFIAATSTRPGSAAIRMPAGMFAVTLLMFLFSFLYAYNAGLEYIQRFSQTSDILSFAPDTGAEKIYATFMYFPFLAADLAAVFIFKKGKRLPESFIRLFLTLLSSALYSLSFPSFLHGTGFAPLAFVSLVPLLLLLDRADILGGIFWAVMFGVFQTTLINYWLSTFSLVSLQAVIAIYLFHYMVFMTAAVIAYQKSGRLGWIVFPLAWVTLEYFRAKGFTAYPWCPLGSSQYRFTGLIQIASITGVYGISFLLALVNSTIAHAFCSVSRKPFARYAPPAAAALLFALTLAWGNHEIDRLEGQEVRKKITLSLIQQNTDPRKTDYRETFEVLKKLTDSALSETGGKTDLVVWSETAYVPNIRRWGSTPPEQHYLASLTHEFLDYQKKGGFYLLTGNDDYELIGKEGEITRNSYNAAVFLSNIGERKGTYRKIRLVPFTEYFPFEKELPGLYKLLLEMDVNLWEPGAEQTVFRHPEFSFSTPICFEDIFPDFSRNFVREGADVIINISNDYWSLTETEGLQHFMTGMFRAVENRAPLARSTASGLTGVVERTGRIRDTIPFYKPLYSNTVIPLYASAEQSFYTKFGDWFPVTCAAIVFLILAAFLVLSAYGKFGKPAKS